MKSFLKFLAIFAFILCVSALLTPVLFRVLPFKFERIFNRLVMVQSLAALFLFFRPQKNAFQNMGLSRDPAMLRNFFTGFAAGAGVLALLLAVKVLCGKAVFRVEEFSFPAWGFKFIQMFFTGLLVGFIEEVFFRGAVFSFFKNIRLPLLLAVVLTSIFYSSLHFVSGGKPFIGSDPGWLEGFKLVAAPLKSFLQWKSFWNEAVGLFFFGLVLHFMLLRTGSLYASIGIHAGCIFFVKLDSLFADFLNISNWVWGSSKMYDGLAGWIFITFLGAGLYPILGPSRPLERQTSR